MPMIKTFVRSIYSTWLMAAFLAFSGEVTMASSLLMTSPEALVGQWRMYPEGEKPQACKLDLALQSPRLGGDLECIAGWLGERPANWEPTPDGLWLYGAEGTGIVHLNRQKTDRYEVRLKNGTVLVLVRDKP